MISTTFNSTSNSEASSKSENSGVVFELLTDWGSGFQGKIFFTNTTNEPLNDWTLEFNLDNKITNLWNAEIASSSGGKYVIRKDPNKPSIAPGETVHFAFNGEILGNSAPAPTPTPDPMPTPAPMPMPAPMPPHNHGGEHNHNHGGDPVTLPDSEPLVPGGKIFKVDGTTQRITNFDPATDKVDLGMDSIHNQIAIDTPEGITFQNYHHLERSLTLVGVSLKDLKANNFTAISDAHLQQDLSAALAWENGTGYVRPNTVYIRSHEQGLQEEVDFDLAKDKISFFYLSVRGDSQQNFSVEETAKGVRFFSPVTGQSMTLKGIKFADLDSSHFEWRANQLEDNIAGRMGLSDRIADFRIIDSNVFSGKSVPMAGGVDRAPYHSQPDYTSTRIGSNPDPVKPDPVTPVDPVKPDPVTPVDPIKPDPVTPVDPVDPVDPITNSSAVDFSIANNWGSGYQGQVEITNKNSSDLNNWTLKFEFAGKINQIWGAEIVSQDGNTYVLRNAPYNGKVASGEKVTFGFIGEGSASNLPDVFELNGKVVGETPTTPTDPEPMKSTIAEIVAQSGGEFDGNNQDFDILLKALQAAGLVDAVADPTADLTVFAPTDSAFIKLAQDLGYQGNNETGAYNAIVDALTELGNGDPIPALQDVLKYHVSAGAKTLNEIKGANSVSTLLDGTTITPNGNTLGDQEPDLSDPTFVSGLTNVEASNGIIQGIDRVLIPLDISGNNPTDPTNPTPPTGNNLGDFNYAEALQKSFLFYEANRSGELPTDNRIPWRGDSALGDGADVGRDLTGGYYDAGDHVKFGLPMAASMTMLAWGVEEYSDAYEKIGQHDEALDAVKWGTDYILKAYDDRGTADVSDDVFYGQVGNGQADHSFWGSPEIMTMERPAYKIDAQNPGSDLAGESAASLASASIIFRSIDSAYADKLLGQAKKLYEFAETYQGKYSDSITDARNFYNSWSGYTDDLAWGATWLHKATKAAGQTDTQYLAKAEQYYQDTNGIQSAPWTQNWDDKKYGTAILLAQETGDTQYQVHVEGWLDRWMVDKSKGGIPTYTSGGLAWLDQWGANRYAANTAMLAGIYADTVKDKGGQYSQFAENQINYLLGDNPNNFSYQIGFGNNYPPTNAPYRICLVSPPLILLLREPCAPR